MEGSNSPLKQVTTLEEAYDVFDLGVGSDFHDVKIRYRQLARQHHPDRTGATNCSIFQHINFAFQVITQKNDKEKRKRARDEEKAAEAEKKRKEAFWQALRDEFPESEKEQRDAKWKAFRDAVMDDELWYARSKAEAKEKAKKRHNMQKHEGFRRLRKMK